ncbi:MAG TPA: FmdB family zinc ribbon protein [Actinomycetes bacterium]|nr:FmdB family zinc ribbon protein [Actinomycetes bacterium]
MPTYEYACTSCGKHLEVVQSMSDAPLTECGTCGGPLRKVFSPIGIVFKGSGFYRTDSRSAAGVGARRDAKESAKEARSTKDAKESKESKEAKGGSGPPAAAGGGTASGGAEKTA